MNKEKSIYQLNIEHLFFSCIKKETLGGIKNGNNN